MKVYNEEDYLMLSGIQHFAFVPKTVGVNPYRESMGRECTDSRGKHYAQAGT